MDELQQSIKSLQEQIKDASDTLDARNRELKGLSSERKKLCDRIEVVEKSISALTNKINTLNKKLEKKQKEYAEKQSEDRNKLSNFYNKFVQYLANSYVDAELTQCYGGKRLRSRKTKVEYMMTYLDNPENLRFLYNNEKARVTGVYMMLSGESLSSDEIDKRINDLIAFKEEFKPKVLDITPLDNSKVTPKKSGTDVDAKTYFSSGKFKKSRGTVPKSDTVSAGEVLTVEVKDFGIRSMQLKGEDNKYNVLTARTFLCIGKSKVYNTREGKVSLWKMPIQAVGFNTDKSRDLVFGGVRRRGCLAYKNLNVIGDSNYTMSVVTMNNTQIFNALFLAVIKSGDYEKYADEFFAQEYADECRNMTGSEFLFERPEGYRLSEDNYFPTVCRVDDKVICTGSHYGWDKEDKLGYILTLIHKFVTYISEHESDTKAGQTRLFDSILSGITMYGWYDSSMQYGEPFSIE